MYFVSKVTPLFFLLALGCLLTSLILRVIGYSLFDYLPFLVSGFLGMTLTGAMYQIIPNSQGRRLKAYPLAFASFLLALLSFLFFALGIPVVGSSLLLLSHIIFLIQITATLKNLSPPTVRFLVLSAVFLTFSSLVLFVNYLSGLFTLQGWVHCLTVGSMLSAIYGVELAWIPMLLMESVSIREAQRIFFMKLLSTPPLIAGFLTLNYGLILISSVLEIVTALYFVKVMFSLIRRRRSPVTMTPVLKMFLWGLAFLLPGILTGSLMSAFPAVIPAVVDVHIDLLVFGTGLLTIMGGTTHLLPRIIWQSRKKGTVSDYVDEGKAEFLSRTAPPGILLYLLLNALNLKIFAFLLVMAILFVWMRATFLPALMYSIGGKNDEDQTA